jgi:hypothetical protein
MTARARSRSGVTSLGEETKMRYSGGSTGGMAQPEF